MSIGFLNAALLAGLLAVGLPVIAHLLSKRRYDVEHWGAMQFLRLGQRTRRRIQIQDLLLLLLRMAVIGVLALALARPWGQGGVFGSLASAVSRDVVFVIDGSGSMDWRGGQQIPHQQAIQWIHDALEDLQPSDTVALIDARAQNRRLIHPPTSDFARVRVALEEIAEPAGTSNLSAAILDAVQILSTTANVTREVIVLTDLQAYPWNVDDQFVWQRIDELRKQPAIPPSIAVVDLSGGEGDRNNFSVDQIRMSRELTVPGFPIRFQTAIRQSGGAAVQKDVSLAINGQPAPELTRTINLLPNGESLVDFTYVFPENGFYTVSISVEEDRLPKDDQAEAVVLVEDGIPVLLVDGAPSQDEPQSETFFLNAAFASSGVDSRWVQATRIRTAELNQKSLAGQRVVMLCNVEMLTRQQQAELIEFVSAGGGLVVAPGSETNPTEWNSFRDEHEVHVLPLAFKKMETEQTGNDEQINIDSPSLKTPWLERFQKDKGVDFCTSRFSSWWDLAPHEAAAPPDENQAAFPELSEPEPLDGSTSSVIARLTNLSPFIVSSRYGNGTVVQLSVPLDADWSTLPARTDFVPFVHELIFQLADLNAPHNVTVGSNLLVQLDRDQRPRDYVVSGPSVQDGTPVLKRDGATSFAVFNDTAIAGRYTFTKRNDPAAKDIPFVVNDDGDESELTRLDEIGWETLAADDRMQLVESMSELTSQNQATHARTELWWLLLLAILGMLVCEVFLTRKMVQGGHTDLAADEA